MMNLIKRFLFALPLSVLNLVGCGDDAPRTPGGICRVGALCVPQVTCTPTGDAEQRTFPIAQMAIPSRPTSNAPLPAVGFNIDGLTSTQTDLAGCNMADLPGGIDNGLAALMPPTNDPLIAPLGAHLSLQAQVDSGRIALMLTMDDWNGTSDDDCVRFTLSGTSSGQSIPALVGASPLTMGFTQDVWFGSTRTLTLSTRLALNAGGGLEVCETDCVEYDLPIVIERVMGRFRFGPEMSSLVFDPSPTTTNSSMLGGYVRYVGVDSGAVAVHLEPIVRTIDPSGWPSFDAQMRDHLDLDSTPSLSACTFVDAGGTSADTLSVALLVSSVPLP